MCGRFLPLSDFPKDGNKYRPNCKLCHSNKYVVCGGCKKKRPEAEMMIYTLMVFSATNPKPTDKYYCNQTCKNIADGVLRDRDGEGFIREWL